jgi:hypothetical protein
MACSCAWRVSSAVLETRQAHEHSAEKDSEMACAKRSVAPNTQVRPESPDHHVHHMSHHLRHHPFGLRKKNPNGSWKPNTSARTPFSICCGCDTVYTSPRVSLNIITIFLYCFWNLMEPHLTFFSLLSFRVNLRETWVLILDRLDIHSGIDISSEFYVTFLSVRNLN